MISNFEGTQIPRPFSDYIGYHNHDGTPERDVQTETGIYRPLDPFQEKMVAASLEVTLSGLLGSIQVAAGLSLKLQAEMEGRVSAKLRCSSVGDSTNSEDSPRLELIYKLMQNIQLSP